MLVINIHYKMQSEIRKAEQHLFLQASMKSGEKKWALTAVVKSMTLGLE